MCCKNDPPNLKPKTPSNAQEPHIDNKKGEDQRDLQRFSK